MVEFLRCSCEEDGGVISAAVGGKSLGPVPTGRPVLPGLPPPDPDPDRQELREAKTTRSRLRRELEFERILNLIYGSQLSLLGHLVRNGEAGESRINLFTTFYQNHVQAITPQNAGSFEAYLGFLVANNLIEFVGDPNDPRLRLAANGMEFVAYVQSRYPGMAKPY